MVDEHYFSSDPAAPKKTVRLTVEVGGVAIPLEAASGTFSSGRLDPGTAVLLAESEHFPKDGNVLDLGCGWGPIGVSIAKICPNTQVFGIDINQRSVEQSNLNAALNDLTNFRAMKPDQLDPNLTFSAIWSNPPIRVGKAVLHELMLSYVPRLEPGGKATLVVSKNLGADSFQRWLSEQFPDSEVTRLATAKGYRVLQLVKLPSYPKK